MNDRNQDSKNQRITYTATNEGIERANRALARDFGSKTNFDKNSLVSRSTITKFFGQKPIQLDCFQQICEELQLSDWQEIARIKPTEKLTERGIDSPRSTCPNESREPVQTLTRRITVTDEEKNTILAIITLAGDIESAPNKEIFETILHEHSGKTIKILDRKEGSIKLVIEGSPEDIKQIESLIKSNQITELSGFPVEEIEIIDESSDSQETNKPNNKWSLVKEIISQPVQGRDLREADLSDADLTYTKLISANLTYTKLIGADLSDADLSDADLSDADLSDADLTYTKLIGAKLKRAKLIGANLRRTDLRDADLRDADLRDADLIGADLRDANLRDADLIGADLIGANLRDADLRYVKVNNACFGYNEGISDSLRQDLIKRGAIFEDTPGDRSKS